MFFVLVDLAFPQLHSFKLVDIFKIYARKQKGVFFSEHVQSMFMSSSSLGKDFTCRLYLCRISVDRRCHGQPVCDSVRQWTDHGRGQPADDVHRQHWTEKCRQHQQHSCLSTMYETPLFSLTSVASQVPHTVHAQTTQL